jgi:hypothetical protein
MWIILNEFPKYEINKKGDIRNIRTGKLCKPFVSEKGYLKVMLYKTSRTNSKIPRRVHRLVAQVFIPNPENKPQVNHKDGNKQNNNDWNLEWVTNIENKEHAEKNNLVAQQRKPVVQYTLEGEYINEFISITESANAVSGKQSQISNCCRGKQHTAYGYKWRWKN